MNIQPTTQSTVSAIGPIKATICPSPSWSDAAKSATRRNQVLTHWGRLAAIIGMLTVGISSRAQVTVSLPPYALSDLNASATLGPPQVSSSSNLTYQWFLTGNPISGATNSTYTTPNNLLAGLYPYSLTITDSGVPATNLPITLVHGASLLDSPASWSINHNNGGAWLTFPFIGGNTFHMTDNQSDEACSAWFNSPGTVPIAGFTAAFTYQDVSVGGAEGFSFCLQNSSLSARGANGVNIGVVGITPSVEFDFDINGAQSPLDGNNGGYALLTNGAAVGSYSSNAPVMLAGGDPINVFITYNSSTFNLALTMIDATTADVFTTNLNVGNLTSTLGTNGAYPGFTAGTGATHATQIVSNFVFLYTSPGVTITVPPTNVNTSSGQPATFTVTASGSPPLTYQWQFGGTNIAGATQSSYSIAQAQFANAGTYTVVVGSQNATNTVSASATLAVSPYVAASLPPFAISDLNAPATLGPPQVSSSSNLTYQWYLAGSPIAGATNPTYTTPNNLPAGLYAYSLAITNGGFAATNLPITLVHGASLLDSPAQWSINRNGASWITFPFIGGNTFHMTDNQSNEACSAWFNSPGTVPVAGFTAAFTFQDVSVGGAEGFSFCLQNSSLSARGANGVNIGVVGITPSVEFDFDINSAQSPLDGHNGGYSLLTNGAAVGSYSGNPPVMLAGGDPINVFITYNSITFNLALTMIDATTADVFTTNLNVGDLTSTLGTNGAYPGFTAGTGATYATQVVSNFVFLYTSPTVTITTPPTNVNVAFGQPVTFSVAASGSPPLTYQWQFGGTNIAGATQSSYSIAQAQTANAGTYTVVVGSQNATNTASASATLTVSGNGNITATIQPASSSLFTGLSQTFTAVASGFPPLTYQWYNGSNAIAGATNSTYSTPTNLSAGSYVIIVGVSNSVPSFAQASASLTIKAPSPFEQTALQFSPAAFWPLDEPASNTVAYDYVGGNNGAYTNEPGVSPGQPGPTLPLMGGQSSAAFSGPAGNGYIDVPRNNLDIKGSLTMFAWLRATNAPNFEAFFGHSDSSYHMDLDTSGFPHFTVNPAGPAVGSTAVDDSNWHMITGVYNSTNGNRTLFVDGSPVPNSSSGTGPAGSSLNVIIGGDPQYIPSRLFTGNIADCAIYNVALTSNQVQQLYLAAGIGPTTMLPTSQFFGDRNGSASLTAMVSGTTPLSLQWYYFDTNAPPVVHSVPGQTSATLTLNNLAASQNGFMYFLVATNVYGSSSNQSAQFPATLTVISPTPGSVNVLTYHNDNARTGQNTNENILTPAVVSSTNFGKIFSHDVDGYVHAQPLVMTHVNTPGKGTHNVVYVATEHDSVYAFDADNDVGGNAAPLWQVSFINPAAGVTTVRPGDVSCADLIQEIGITATPVIDPATSTIYIEAETRETTSGVTSFYHRLHALDLATGAEKFGGPVVVQATVPGTGDGSDGEGHLAFNPKTQLFRPALLLSGGVVYISCGSFCDVDPYHGWLFGYDAHTLVLSNVFNITPNGNEGALWMSGSGPAVDTAGNIYLGTGNGAFDPSPQVANFGESFLKFSTTNGLAVADYFTPYNQADLSARDLDLGSGGTVLLPDEAGDGGANQHLLVSASKGGTVYLINRDNMGHYNTNNDNAIVQEIPNAVFSFDTPAYFNHHLYYVGNGTILKSFTITNAVINTNNIGFSEDDYDYPGATPVISANGTNNAIVWALDPRGASSGGPAVLKAYDAMNVANELYNSSVAESGARDNPGAAVKFAVPTVANGKVYVGAQFALSVYGSGNFTPSPVISPSPRVFADSLQITLSDAAPGASIYYSRDGSTPSTNSIPYSSPFSITGSTGVRARAFQPNYLPSAVASSTFLNTKSVGTGTGLNGAYYSGQIRTFTNPPTLMRTDPSVNFDWSSAPPDPTINSNIFTVMWSGLIQPQFSETYTFYTTTEDGARLWLDGQLLVDGWLRFFVPLQWQASVALQAGKYYPVTMEFYQNGDTPSAQLAWSSPSTTKSVIPPSQLYSRAPALVSFIGGPAGGAQLEVNGLPGKDYILQTSTNLQNWTALQTNVAPPNPQVSLPTNLTFFVDLSATNIPSRFYRVLQQP